MDNEIQRWYTHRTQSCVTFILFLNLFLVFTSCQDRPSFWCFC